MPGKGSDPSRTATRATSAQERERVEAVLRDGGVRAVFQPIVDMARTAVIGFEALTRPDPATGFTSPLDLFDAASRCGMLWELESLTRRRIIESAAGWPEGALLFINCNPEVAADPRFPEEMLALLGESDCLTPSSIVLEITERAETLRTRTLLDHIHKLRASGMQIAIDDVGAGANGLQRIMDLRPNWLKLDRELITTIDTDPYQQNLLDVLLRFARISGVSLIAEGIERKEQLATLLDLGVQHVQGYLMGRPDAKPQDFDAELCLWVRRLTEAGERKLRSPKLAFVADIMREAVVCQGHTTLFDARARLLDAPEATGVVIPWDARHRRWMPRERAFDGAFDGRTATSLRSLTSSAATCVPSTMLVSEALLLVSTRSPGVISESLVVEHAGEIMGEVSLRDLLREAARITGDIESGAGQVAGLPGRVQCDRRFSTMVRQREALHALFIDIRGFHAYNEHFGFQLGDLILRILEGVVTNAIGDESNADREFAGYLGDDRFVILTATDDPGALARGIIEEFESATDRFVACSDSMDRGAAGGDNTPSAGLRVLVIKNPADRCQTGADLHRLVWSQRDDGASTPIGRSQVIEPRDAQGDRPQARMSA